MTYPATEQSIDLGSPINLFEFVYGDSIDDVYRYNNTTHELFLVGRVWQPFNIKHSAIVSAGSLDRSELTINAPSDIELSDLFLVTPPSRQILLNIWRGHALTLNEGIDDDFVRIWTGRVLTPNWSDSELELSCEAIATSIKRIGLRRYYQYGCSHVLYGTACKVPLASSLGVGVVAQIFDTVTLDVALTSVPPGLSADRLVGGVLSYDYLGGVRSLRSIIAAQSVDGRMRMTLMSGINAMAVNTPITVSFGCKHTWEACQQFGNTVNYGGCPNIPTKDPYRTNTF